MKKLNYFLVLLSAYSQLFFSQQKEVRTFREIRSNYEKMTIDDERAMPFVKDYIQKAKSESDISQLIQGYRDGRQFDYKSKMKYADSALAFSIKYGSNDDISKDYLSKGIIYYFYQKKYKLALNQYMKAYEFSKGSDDQYQHYKVIYHLGVVKAHLGYYDEALEHFQDCSQFYEKAMNQKGLHENLQFNNKKAYLNSLHQMTVANRYLKNVSTSDSLNKLGYKLTAGDRDFLLENSYFLKCLGISKFLKNDYEGAASDLNSALPEILKRNDFAWVSVIYYYLGKISEAKNQEEVVIGYYSKIDSIFVKEGFILPEVYKSYNYLISYYKNKDLGKQLYYTEQLLKADSMISKDYPYLSGKLHREYDRRSLIEQKEDIEKAGKKNIRIAQFLIFTSTLTIIFFVIRFQKDRKIKKQYDLLQKKLKEGSYGIPDIVEVQPQEYSLRKTFLTPELTIEIGEKLKKFERELQFTKKGITQNSIAVKLNTNANYLSIYINENKGMNFTRYIAELRIKYITNLLNTNTKYLNYTIEALAEECGIAARQNFSNLFYDINGIRPTDYIKKRKKELRIG
ncbi:Helix-turn-helix domain-containing protein [Chryseobacterium taichungense]|uniref:Helix-turn-helix domain-containing protein n=1 Tax=Chryseobacterium taichungense TaxID=295069 RepID=A0A1H8CB36_9FLAO|nr:MULTISPECIES: helix-turn-helix domain-containing protein [Chryseobacterium]SEM91654.1 Helix-turn-helix domain-containing protein [Chryseobacterium taichungense]